MKNTKEHIMLKELDLIMEGDGVTDPCTLCSYNGRCQHSVFEGKVVLYICYEDLAKEAYFVNKNSFKG